MFMFIFTVEFIGGVYFRGVGFVLFPFIFYRKLRLECTGMGLTKLQNWVKRQQAHIVDLPSIAFEERSYILSSDTSVKVTWQ